MIEGIITVFTALKVLTASTAITNWACSKVSNFYVISTSSKVLSVAVSGKNAG
jgi:hypothetical protein